MTLFQTESNLPRVNRGWYIPIRSRLCPESAVFLERQRDYQYSLRVSKRRMGLQCRWLEGDESVSEVEKGRWEGTVIRMIVELILCESIYDQSVEGEDTLG